MDRYIQNIHMYEPHYMFISWTCIQYTHVCLPHQSSRVLDPVSLSARIGYARLFMWCMFRPTTQNTSFPVNPPTHFFPEFNYLCNCQRSRGVVDKSALIRLEPAGLTLDRRPPNPRPRRLVGLRLETRNFFLVGLI